MKTALHVLFLSLLALLMSACGDNNDHKDCSHNWNTCYPEPETDAGIDAEPETDSGSEPDAGSDAEPETDAEIDAEPDAEPDPVNQVCLSILDQRDQIMTGCTYDLPEDINSLEGDEQCTEGQLLVQGQPGTYRVEAECGDLIGYVEVPLELGDNGVLASRLVGSLCYNDAQPIVLDSAHTEVSLGEYLGYSTATRCANWFGHDEVYETEVAGIVLDCETVEGDCQPIDGRDYLQIKGRWGLYSDGWPIHLTMVADISMVAPGQEVTVLVIVREMYGPEQELTIPIIIRGPEG